MSEWSCPVTCYAFNVWRINLSPGGPDVIASLENSLGFNVDDIPEALKADKAN
jgi:hypothetical protein